MRAEQQNAAGSGMGRGQAARDRAAGNRWAIVLAAGEGSRLSDITRDRDGMPVPKQFCSLSGETTLLDDALARARCVAPVERIVVIVAADQEQHWRKQLTGVPSGNIVVQPQNRGTAVGILLPTLHVLLQDPEARIVCLPSDHYVANESALAAAIDAALADLSTADREAIFLGIEPDEADPGLGYIAPSSPAGQASARIARFIEKPDRAVARKLIDGGALWNSFIFAATGKAIVRLVEERFPAVVLGIARAMQGANRREALARFYEGLQPIDFSRHVVEGAEAFLRVRAVPECGWSDLGTPERLGECLDRFQPGRRLRTHNNFVHECINLAEAYRCFASSPALGSAA